MALLLQGRRIFLRSCVRGEEKPTQVMRNGSWDLPKEGLVPTGFCPAKKACVVKFALAANAHREHPLGTDDPVQRHFAIRIYPDFRRRNIRWKGNHEADGPEARGIVNSLGPVPVPIIVGALRDEGVDFPGSIGKTLCSGQARLRESVEAHELPLRWICLYSQRETRASKWQTRTLKHLCCGHHSSNLTISSVMLPKKISFFAACNASNVFHASALSSSNASCR